MLVGEGLYIAKLDGEKNKKMNDKYGVKSFPTLKFFKNGAFVDYKGKREATAISQYVNKKSSPAFTAITCDKLDEAASANTLNMIFFGPSSGPEWNIFDIVGSQHGVDSFTFFHTGAECAETYKVTAPGMAIVRNFDEKVVPYAGDMDVGSVLNFMFSNEVPEIFEFS